MRYTLRYLSFTPQTFGNQFLTQEYKGQRIPDEIESQAVVVSERWLPGVDNSGG
jgi:hypothetical protein